MLKIEQKKYYHLGANTLWLFVLQYVCSPFIFFIIAIGLSYSRSYFSDPNFLTIIDYIVSACFVLWIISMVVGAFIAIMQYQTCLIMLDESSFHLIRGIFSKEEVAIPHRWIQSVDIEQSLFLRIMGVARLIVTTINSLEEAVQPKDKLSDRVISFMDIQLARLVAQELTNRAEVEKMQMQK